MYHTCFIHLSADGHLGGFPIQAIVSDAAENIWAYIFSNQCIIDESKLYILSLSSINFLSTLLENLFESSLLYSLVHEAKTPKGKNYGSFNVQCFLQSPSPSLSLSLSFSLCLCLCFFLISIYLSSHYPSIPCIYDITIFFLSLSFGVLASYTKEY